MKKIVFIDHQIKANLKEKIKTKELIDSIFLTEKIEYEAVVFIFCNDKYLLTLNKKFLLKNTLTDIITFNLSDNCLVNSEIYISIDRIKDNATLFGTPYLQELRRVIIHGILHLCGYKDYNKLQQKKMRKKEDHYLKKFVSRET